MLEGLEVWVEGWFRFPVEVFRAEDLPEKSSRPTRIKERQHVSERRCKLEAVYSFLFHRSLRAPWNSELGERLFPGTSGLHFHGNVAEAMWVRPTGRAREVDESPLK